MNEETKIHILPTDTCFGIACALDDKKSYEQIYKIKKRSLEKPIAIMVPNFTWLEKNTELTSEQIEFLKEYDRPFTILTESSPVRLFLDFQDENGEMFINNSVYDQLSFRVAENDIEEKLTNTLGPIWLTSANLANQGEIYSLDKIHETFEYYIEKDIIEVHGSYDLDSDVAASDVFSFVGESLEVEYLRKA